jgi:hypothetical protein
MTFLSVHYLVLNNMLCRRFRSSQMCCWPIMGDTSRNWVICGSPEKGHNYMCSEGAQHQQETNLGSMWLSTVKSLKRAETWPLYSTPTHNHVPTTPPLVGTPILPSLHRLDEENYITQPASWPHFINP